MGGAIDATEEESIRDRNHLYRLIGDGFLTLSLNQTKDEGKVSRQKFRPDSPL
jgi:hypothetical protein